MFLILRYSEILNKMKWHKNWVVNSKLYGFGYAEIIMTLGWYFTKVIALPIIAGVASGMEQMSDERNKWLNTCEGAFLCDFYLWL